MCIRDRNFFNLVPLGPVSLRHHKEIGPFEPVQRFTQRAARQKMAVADRIARIDKNYIQIAFNLPMLKRVVKKKDIRSELVHRPLSRYGTIFTGNNGNTRQRAGQENGFIA